MNPVRLIARLDVKNDRLIKSVQLEGVRVVGEPRDAAEAYYRQGADEVLLMDAVASLYGRNHLFDLVRFVSENVFLPLTAGGGLRSLDDVHQMLRAGADKVAINTACVQRPELIEEVARKYGAQCMVLQIDAKRKAPDRWEVYTDGGREPTGQDVVAWAREAVARGAGEILLTSVDREGTGKGFDTALVRTVTAAVSVPVIACGGMGGTDDLIEVVREAGADAVAMAYVLHVRHQPIDELKRAACEAGIPVRLK